MRGSAEARKPIQHPIHAPNHLREIMESPYG